MQLSIFPLDNNYQIIRQLGEGGFGRVWLAQDIRLSSRYVAIKQLKSDDVGDAALLIEEMDHLSKLDHPHVVKFLHHFQDRENIYLVMEHCGGGSVAALIQRQPISKTQVFAWAKILTDTLTTIHQRGIVHHDIKPQNLLLTDDGRIKIADFGVANRNWGTRSYMAPELALGEASSDDVRIDIYALGITLLEMLLRKNPLRRIADNELLRSKIEHDFIPLNLDRWVQEILLKATHPTPELRFQSMADFGEAIESRHVPFIIDSDRMKAHRLAEKAAALLARKKWVTARKSISQALHVVPDCVAALIVAGRLELMLRRTTHAKAYFSEAVRISPRVALQKELGWIALEEANYAQAISMLTDHLQREAADFEACNLLMRCFFQTDRYEIGAQLARTVIKQGAANECFENNQFLFRLLAEGDAKGFLENVVKDSLTNPFTRLNFEIATETPSSWSRKDRPTLKSKLLFQDYRFNTKKTRNSAPMMFFDCGDGYTPYSFKTPIITLGRFGTNTITFNQNGLSRRHAAIINHADDVWIYDLGSVAGTSVDGVPVVGRAFLDGVHTVDIGSRKIRVATEKGLLI